jgi:hypothetical protein
MPKPKRPPRAQRKLLIQALLDRIIKSIEPKGGKSCPR